MVTSQSARRWYLLQCKPAQCFRALEHLNNQNIVGFLPTMTREVLRSGRRVTLVEPLFPHYLFVHLDDVSDNWAPIRSTRGVARMVTFGQLPLAVPDAIVAALQQAETAGSVVEDIFHQGQSVEIVAGPLAGLSAVYAARDGDERVIVLLKILHQEQSLKLPIEQIRAADC